MAARFLLLVVSLLLVLLLASSSAAADIPSENIYFNVATEPYSALSSRLRTLLSRPSTPPYNPTNVSERYVLGQRRPDYTSPPWTWIMVHIRFGPAPADTTTLALAADDLYLLGFRNRTGRWHILDGPDGGFSGLPGPASDVVTLPFKQNYGDLVKGGHESLPTVPLGKQSAIQAARTLSSYDRSRTPDAQAEQAMARFVLMVCEAMRFRVIRNTFNGPRWEQQTFIDLKSAKYVVHWGKLSRLLVRWQRIRSRPWPADDRDVKAVALVGIHNANDAWLILDFLLRPFSI